MLIWFLQLIALLLAITVPHLLDVGYALYSFETIVIAAMLTGVALFAARIAGWSGELGLFMLAFLGYWLADTYFLGVQPAAILVLPLLYIALRSPWSEGFRRGMGVFAAVFLLTSAAFNHGSMLDRPLPQSGEQTSDLPLFLHIIVDENASHAAMATIHPSLGADALRNDYVTRGFRVFDSTRATSGSTVRSLTATFGGRVGRDLGQFSYSVLDAEYPDVLSDVGYNLAVIQSNFLELCNPEAASCRTYNRNTHGRQMARFGTRDTGRLRIATDVLRADYLSRKSVRSIALLSALGIESMDGKIVFPRPAAMLGLLDDLEAHFRSNRQGEAYVVHLMLPHFPYVLDSDCGLVNRERWVVLDLLGREIPPHLTPATIEEAYAGQVLCTHSRIMRLVDQVQASNPEAVILVQGDHGLRLDSMHHVPEDEEMESTEPQRHLDLLFAMRAPWIEPGVNEEIETLPERFRNLVLECLGPVSDSSCRGR